MSYVPSDQFRYVHEGEGILTAAQNREYMGGGASQGMQVTVEAIYASSYEEGRAAARGFEEELQALWQSRGN